MDDDIEALLEIVSVAALKPGRCGDTAWRRRLADSALDRRPPYGGPVGEATRALVERWVSGEVGVEALDAAIRT